MELINTLYIGCEDDGSNAELGKSHTFRFTHVHGHGYCTMNSAFGLMFFQAQDLQNDNYLDEPYRACIISENKKFKEEDTETNVDRYQFLCNNFVPPKKGIIISFYEEDIGLPEKKFTTPYGNYFIWPFKKQWKKENAKDYVVVQAVDELLNNPITSYSYSTIDKPYYNIINELEKFQINYKLVSYKTPIKELFDTMVNSSLLLSYSGSSYYFAAGMGLPTLGYGPDTWTATNQLIQLIPSGKPLPPNRKRLQTAWGENCIGSGKVLALDKDNNIYYNKRIDTVTNIGKVETEEDYKVFRNKLREHCWDK